MIHTVLFPSNLNTQTHIARLKEISAIEDSGAVIVTAIAIAALSVKQAEKNNDTLRVLDDRGSSWSKSGDTFFLSNLKRDIAAQPVDKKTVINPMAVSTKTKIELDAIKDKMGLSSDEEAIKFALHLTVTTAQAMQENPAKSYIIFTPTWDMAGTKLNTPFDKTLRASFQRNCRRVKTAVKKACAVVKFPKI